MSDKSFKTYPIGYSKMKITLKTHFRFPIGYKFVSKQGCFSPKKEIIPPGLTWQNVDRYILAHP